MPLQHIPPTGCGHNSIAWRSTILHIAAPRRMNIHDFRGGIVSGMSHGTTQSNR